MWHSVSRWWVQSYAYKPLLPTQPQRKASKTLICCVLSFLFGAASSIFLYSRHSVQPVDVDAKVLGPTIDKFIDNILTEWDCLGIAVAVVRRKPDGSWNVETKGYGKATLDGTPVTEETLFQIGSNTKVRIHYSLKY